MRPARSLVLLTAAPILALLVLPFVALVVASSPTDLAAGVRSPLFGPALWLSARTTAASMAIVVLTGTPLAWWLASSVLFAFVSIPVAALNAVIAGVLVVWMLVRPAPATGRR